MADIYGSHFEYGNTSSRTYDLVFANMNTSRFMSIAGKIEGITVFNKKVQARYLVDDNYANFPVSFDVEIITEDASPISIANQRLIEKWLFNKHNYRKLYIDQVDDTQGVFSEMIDGSVKRLYLNCRFMNPERIENDCNVIGYKATLEADSGLWWQDAVTQTFDIEESGNYPVVVVDTDIDEFTYPKVVINIGNEGGDVIITNTTDSSTRLTKFVNLTANSIITIKGNTNYVSGQNYTKFENMNFPRLLDGNNTFSIEGDVSSISFEFNNRRFL